MEIVSIKLGKCGLYRFMECMVHEAWTFTNFLTLDELVQFAMQYNASSRYTKFSGDRQLTLVYLFSKFGEYWIYGGNPRPHLEFSNYNTVWRSALFNLSSLT